LIRFVIKFCFYFCIFNLIKKDKIKLKDKDGFISKEELIKACAKSGYPIADDMANGVIQDCDVDCDGRLNFLEFSNFLCYKESMDTGLKFDPSKKIFLFFRFKIMNSVLCFLRRS
jgi:hypothetical protein